MNTIKSYIIILISSLPIFGFANDCVTPITEEGFKKGIVKIENHDFDDAKKKAASDFLTAGCFTVDQIKIILELFSFEEDKLKFATESYSRIVDKENFEKLFVVFDFESSKEALRNHIKEQKAKQ